MLAKERAEWVKKIEDIFHGDIGEVSRRYRIPIDVIQRSRCKSPNLIIGRNYPYRYKMRKATYDRRKHALQIEMVKLQRWIKRTGQRVLILFEGRDAAGKGGAIKRFSEHLNPREAHVVALGKPSKKEQGQWYFQRYIEHLPGEGEMVFFDRSWYNRAGVDVVMGFCSSEDHQQFLWQAPSLEKMLVKSGIIVIKFWFSISQEEQLRRFFWRINDPLKQWKLSSIDIASLGLWEAYTQAKEVMFNYTDTSFSPWTVIRADDKKRARLNAMKYVLSQFGYQDKDQTAIQVVDRRLLGHAAEIYQLEDHQGSRPSLSVH